MTNAPRIPKAPEVNPETESFWAAARDGILMIGHCESCDQSHYYPRTHCPHCFSGYTALRESKGEGEIYSVSVMRRGPSAPYAVAYVALDEGPAVLTNVTAADFDELTIGMRVRVAFQETEDGPPVPHFVPIGD